MEARKIIKIVDTPSIPSVKTDVWTSSDSFSIEVKEMMIKGDNRPALMLLMETDLVRFYITFQSPMSTDCVKDFIEKIT